MKWPTLVIAISVLGCEATRRADSTAARVERWRLADAPTWTLGALDTDSSVAFVTVRDARFLNDSTVLIGHFQRPPTVYVVGPRGDVRKQLGRDGDGPGELRSVDRLWTVSPDTVIVYDFWGRRLNTYLTDGTILTTQLLASDSLRSGRYLIRGRFADGSYLQRRNGYLAGAVGGAGRTTMPAVRIRADGSVIDTIGVFPDVDYVRSTYDRATTPHFGSRAAYLAHGEYYYNGFPDSFSITQYDLHGLPVRSFRRSGTPRKVTPDVLTAHRLATLARTPAGVSSDDWTATFEARPVASWIPMFGPRMIVDPGRNLWVEDYRTPGDTVARWTVFAPDGGIQAELWVPAALQIYDVHTASIVGVVKDEFDVESVVRYALLRSGF